MKLRAWIVVLLAVVVPARCARAQAFQLQSDAFGSAGGVLAGASFSLGFTAGQSVAGAGSGSTLPQYGEVAGFWHPGVLAVLGVESPAPSSDVASFALYPNAPNPFGRETSIRYAIPTATGPVRVRLSVYDLSGRIVRVLDEGVRDAGVHSVTWDGRNAAGRLLGGGVYFCRITAGAFTATRRLVLTPQ